VPRFVPVLVLTLVVAAGCGDDGDDGGGGGGEPAVIGTTAPGALTVEVTARDFSFEPSNLVLDVGRPINITLRVEEGGHNLELDGADGAPVFRFPIVEEGDAAVATVQLDDPGTYVMKCTVPGHEAAGMVAQYVVL
jgi:plastocyanin